MTNAQLELLSVETVSTAMRYIASGNPIDAERVLKRTIAKAYDTGLMHERRFHKDDMRKAAKMYNELAATKS